MRWKYAPGRGEDFMRLFIATLTLLVFATAFSFGQVKDEPQTAIAAKPSAEDVKPMSIFNDEVRLFKFRIDHVTVTPEEAIAFTERYQVKGNPEIIGAYPDPETNALCVIGPPEAELAIRKSLARWTIEMQAFTTPLTMEKRRLQGQRKDLLEDIGSLEIALVDAETGINKKATDAELLKERIAALESELAVVERKIQIANQYLKRINEDPK